MIPELGFFLLLLALIASVLQASLSLFGAAHNNKGMMRAGGRAAYASFLFIAAAFAALMYVHVTDDFTVANVYLNSHTQKPLLYKITGAWASHEGSILLWVLILTVFGAGLARFMPQMPRLFRARAVAVQGLTGLGFLAFIIFTSDPFARLWPPQTEGNDLNPLLQDPGLAFHPPFLYIGYVGFSSVFALAAALLLSADEEEPAALMRLLRPWALVSWASLTFGIAMGSWWAYYELGWGGFWFWDPVENAALMPWLSGTALLHSLIASSTRSVFLRWTTLLSIITFTLSLLGTFLVRSGVLTSVHAFAVDPERGVFVLGLLALAAGGALSLYAFRAHVLRDGPLFEPVSRESALLINNLFLCTACATLVTGTLYPLLLDAIGGGVVSVGAPFYNMTVIPLMMPVAALMVFGPMLRWGGSAYAQALKYSWFAFNLSVIAVIVNLYFAGFKSALAITGVFLGAWVVSGTLLDAARLRRQWVEILPRILAHGGFGIAVLGMAGAGFSENYTLQMQPGQIADLGGYRLELSKIDQVEGSNYEAARGIFHVTKPDGFNVIIPEQRYYPVQGRAITDVAIRTNFLRDLYLALGDEQTDEHGFKSRIVRFNINPLVPWIWLGGTIMALGAVTSMVNAMRKKISRV